MTKMSDGSQISLNKFSFQYIFPYRPTLLDTAEMSYHPCRGSYWAWAESWLCLPAARIWTPGLPHSLLLPGTKTDYNVINASFTGFKS